MGFAEKENNRKTGGVVRKIIGAEQSTDQQLEGHESLENDFPHTIPSENESIDNIVVVPTKEEARSKRVNLLLQPSVHKKAQKKCTELGISMNECINQLLSNWIQ